MSEEKQIVFCDHCKIESNGYFCSNCGRAKILKRIDAEYILSEIGSVLNFDKGILYTIRELLIRPGKNIRNFIHRDRNRLVKPIVFVIICSLTYTVLQQLLNFEDGYVNYSFDSDATSAILFDWVTKNYGYANLLIAIFIACWIKLLFRKHSYNIFETLILLCFIIGMGMLIFSFFGIIDSLIDLKIIDKGFFIGVVYISWGIGQFFDGNKFVNSFKGFMSYMLGLISFTIVLLIIGIVIDWVSK